LYPEPEERDLGTTQSGEIRKDRTVTQWTNQRDTLVDIWKGEGQRGINTIDTIQNTAWAGYNAFTEYLDWYGAKKSKQQLVKASSMADATMLTDKGISVPAKQYGLSVLKELISV
jgi:hypothetical protein